MTGTRAELTGSQLASAAVERATRILLARQDSRGRWSGRSGGDVTLDAEAVLVREFLGVRTAEVTSAVAQQIRSVQLPDGSWMGGAEPEGSGDLSASALAYLVLRLAGDSPDAYHLAVAAGWIRDAGGIEAVGLVARTWLAIFGLAGWTGIRVPAPEFVYLPARYAPVAGQWAGWSRQAVVSLTILGTLRPGRQLPVDLNELRASALVPGQPQPRPRVAQSAAQRMALRRCGQWLVDWQQRSGLPVRGRPYWPCSLVALHSLGYSLAHPVLSDGLAWLDSATARRRRPVGVADGEPLVPAERMPPVRDTAAAVRTLADAGLPASHPALIAAGSWLLAQRIEGPADMAGPRPGAAPSGWSFGRDGYPVAADTAAVLLTLSRISLAGLAGKPAITHAIRWLADIQSRDGSWGRSAAVTALVVQALATHGTPAAAALRRGVVWLLRAQLADGSWPGPGGQPELPATAMVLSALLAAGVVPGKPPVANAVRWLLSAQNPDSGWSSAGGDGPERRSSDVAGTARAVATLVAVGGELTAVEMPSAVRISEAVERGARWLTRAQQADGGWGEGPGSGAGSARSRGERGTAPASRYAQRRRGSLVPGMLLPLGALGQFVAAGGGMPAELADRDQIPRPVTEAGLSGAIGVPQ
jgi:squalene-hopene/tetraprenyl-beta-curcumene cyclase